MHAEALPWSISLPNLVMIAQAIFLLEHRYRHTNLQMQLSTLSMPQLSPERATINASYKILRTFNFKLSTFVTSQQRMRAAQPRHFFPQMWNDVMHHKAEPTAHTNKDIKQQRLQHTKHTSHDESDTSQHHMPGTGIREIMYTEKQQQLF